MVVGMKGNRRLEELSVATANGSNTLSVIASLKEGSGVTAKWWQNGFTSLTIRSSDNYTGNSRIGN